jgi:hypothetical protein
MVASSSSSDEPPPRPASGARWASKTAPPAISQARRDKQPVPQPQLQRPPKPPAIIIPDSDPSDPVEPPPSPSRARASSLRSSLGSPLRRNPGVFAHVVVHEQKKMVKRNGAEYRLMADERAIYFASPTKDGIGIADKAILPDATPEFLAVVQIHGRGKRATVVSPQLEKPFDDRPAQLLGMTYVSLPDNKTKNRTFRVALARDEAYYPITKAKELARVAEREDASARFWIFANKLPAIAPDGRVVSPFGNVYLVESAKNFVVCNENDEMIFMVYKSTERTFSVKGKPPFTPLTAFALSLAIIAK